MNNFKQMFLLTAPFYIALFIALFMLFKCQPSGASQTITHKDSLIIYAKDTTKHSHSTTNILPVQTITVQVPSGNIDTAAILSAYYSKHIYKQDLGDSLISINTIDCVQCNSIDYSNITWQFKKPYQVTKTYTVTETKPVFKGNGLYIGVFAEANKQIYGLGPQANLIFKNNNIGIGYNLFNQSAVIQYSHKIGK